MPQRHEEHAEPNLRNAIFDRQNPDTTVLRGNEDNSSPERPNKCSTMRHELEGNVEHYTKWGDSLWDRPVWKLRHQQNLRSVGEEIARPVLSFLPSCLVSPFVAVVVLLLTVPRQTCLRRPFTFARPSSHSLDSSTNNRLAADSYVFYVSESSVSHFM